MKKFLIQYAVCALSVALMVPLARAQSQPAGLQAAFAKDAGTLSDKFTGLARVMSVRGHRPRPSPIRRKCRKP